MSMIAPTVGGAFSFAEENVTALPFDMTVKVLAVLLNSVTLPVIVSSGEALSVFFAAAGVAAFSAATATWDAPNSRASIRAVIPVNVFVFIFMVSWFHFLVVISNG